MHKSAQQNAWHSKNIVPSKSDGQFPWKQKWVQFLTIKSCIIINVFKKFR